MKFFDQHEQGRRDGYEAGPHHFPGASASIGYKEGFTAGQKERLLTNLLEKKKTFTAQDYGFKTIRPENIHVIVDRASDNED